MAIEKGYTDADTGTPYPTAYWRIIGLTLRPAQQTADVLVSAYVDATAAASKAPVDTRRFTVGPIVYAAVFPPEALVSEATARAYAFLKARAEFAGAKDV